MQSSESYATKRCRSFGVSVLLYMEINKDQNRRLVGRIFSWLAEEHIASRTQSRLIAAEFNSPGARTGQNFRQPWPMGRHFKIPAHVVLWTHRM